MLIPDPFRTRLFRAGLLAFAALCLSLTALTAEPRIALIIGNERYATVAPLDNPGSDARLVAAALEQRGFDVTMLVDADQITLNRAIAQFGRDLRAGGEETTGLFFYAGHAVQSFGANYLLPTDIALTDAADLSLVAVRADAVLRQMASAENRLNMVILDACRNNPFIDVPDMNDNGLAEMKAPRGTFMAYSTAPGSVALDGTGANSPFTTAMVRQMDVPGQSVEHMFKQVRSDVLSDTGGRQTPWEASSLTSDFTFTPAQYVNPEEMAAQRFFDSVKETRDPVQIVLFLRTYPNSEHAPAARVLLAEALDDGGAAVSDSPDAQQAAPAKTGQSEQAMINTAQASGAIADYQAYLDAYPTGVFAELARSEISSMAAKDPDAPPGGLAAAVVTEPPSTATSPQSDAAPLDLTIDTLLPLGDPALTGQSIVTLIGGMPLFPPIEGLPEEIWKEKECSTCHEWTPEALCTQGTSYLSNSGTRALGKEHPYGGGFKAVLKDWAKGGCR